jgi:hypothetical protein
LDSAQQGRDDQNTARQWGGHCAEEWGMLESLLFCAVAQPKRRFSALERGTGVRMQKHT